MSINSSAINAIVHVCTYTIPSILSNPQTGLIGVFSNYEKAVNAGRCLIDKIILDASDESEQSPMLLLAQKQGLLYWYSSVWDDESAVGEKKMFEEDEGDANEKVGRGWSGGEWVEWVRYGNSRIEIRVRAVVVG